MKENSIKKINIISKIFGAFVKICKILFVILIIYWIYGIMMMNPNLKKTEQIGNEVVKNIELYKVNYGDYPSKLENLIPEYYTKIPKSKSGTKKFHYILEDDKKSYILFSTFGMTGTYSYYSDLKEWSKFVKNSIK